MNTATGGRFWLLDPRSEDVTVEDIARHLSRICRYNGALKDGIEVYSVAQHARLISEWMEEDGYPAEVCYAALHHDSPEYAVGDNTTQMKDSVPGIRKIEKGVEGPIFRALGMPRLSANMWSAIKSYDLIALSTEVEQLTDRRQPFYSEVRAAAGDDHAWPSARDTIIRPQLPSKAREWFLARHAYLIKQMETAHVRAAFA